MPDTCPASEFSEPFVDGMRNRMAISYHKYGPVKKAFPNLVNAMDTLRARLAQYEQTGNTEFLMDVANYAMIEFMLPAHPQAFYQATDSNASPGRVWHGSGRPKRLDNKGEQL